MFDWNGVRLFLAVAAEGSALAAGRKLGLNQTTVTRRISALEHALGLSLFERRPNGYGLTEDGRAMLDVAGQMQAAAINFERRSARLTRRHDRLIRLTSTPVIGQLVALPLMTSFLATHDGVRFELDDQNSGLGFDSDRADVGFLAVDEIRGADLVVRVLARPPWGLYCSRAHARDLGMPENLAQLNRFRHVGFAPEMLSQNQKLDWLSRHTDATTHSYQVNSVAGMVATLLATPAVGALPCLVGDSEPELQCCFVDESLTHKLWIVIAPAVRDLAVIRDFLRHVGRHFPHHLFER